MGFGIRGTTHFSDAGIRVRLVQGGSAGNITVTGINPRDKLLSVNRVVVAAAVTHGISITGSTDITSQFSITAADTINNTGGTDTSNNILLVVYAVGSTLAAG